MTASSSNRRPAAMKVLDFERDLQNVQPGDIVDFDAQVRLGDDPTPRSVGMKMECTGHHGRILTLEGCMEDGTRVKMVIDAELHDGSAWRKED